MDTVYVVSSTCDWRLCSIHVLGGWHPVGWLGIQKLTFTA